MIQFSCPSCGQSYRVPDEKAGVKAKCKKCESPMQVPVPQPVAQETEIDDAGVPDERGHFETTPGAQIGDEPTRGIRRPSKRGSKDANLQSRPYPPSEEIDRRRRNIFILGIVLITVFFLPACQPDFSGRGSGMKLSFMNIEMLFESGVDAVTKFMMIYPLLAGIAVAVVAHKMVPPARGIVLAILGLAPIAINLLHAEAMDMFQFFGPGMGSIGVTVILLFLGMLGVFVGARVRWYRPGLTHAYIIGAIGALMLIFSFLIPMQGSMLIQAPFKMMDQSVMGGVGFLIAMGLFIGAGLFCLINVPGKSLPDASRFSGIAFRSLVGGSVIFPVTIMLAGLISAMQYSGGFAPAVGMMWTMLKIMTWLVATLLLLPMGVTDAMVDVPVTNPDGCSACGYDLRGNSGVGVCPECGHVNW